MLSAGGRRARGIAIVLVAGALVAGTAWGDDDHFPFGPFRMFSTSNELNGIVKAARLRGVTSSGQNLELEFSDLGLRRAEVEGQIPRFVADPSLLRHFAVAYSRAHPRGSPLAEVSLVIDIRTLVEGVPTSEREETVASWESR